MARFLRWFWIQAFAFVGYENPEYRLDYPEIYAEWRRQRDLAADEARRVVPVSDDIFVKGRPGATSHSRR